VFLVRGAARLSEDIVAVRDGGIDLGEAMHRIIKGKYTLAFCKGKQDATCHQKDDRNYNETFTFDWNPELTTIVSARRLPAGLYDVSSADSLDQEAPGLTISVRILICASQAVVPARTAFRQTQRSTGKWSSQVTAHLFLRAYLAQLYRNGICTDH
jgi:hypothetical protein